MKLNAWLASLSSQTLLTDSKVICFSSQTYPSLFISYVLQYSRAHCGISSVHIDPAENFDTMQQQLSISFLGMQQCYWLGSLDAIAVQQQKDWVQFLQKYTGPHSIMYHSSANPSAAIQTIVVPEALNYTEFEEITCRLFPAISLQRCRLFEPVFNRRGSLALEAAALLMSYIPVISVQHVQTFLDSWVDILLVPDYSLFTLSGYLFARDTKSFFSLWQVMRSAYNTQFWITYWSEQVFNASQYMQAKALNDGVAMKKFSYRLPFSFLQRDWKKHNLENLRLVHSMLYDFDYRVKQGSDERFLEMIYHQCLV